MAIAGRGSLRIRGRADFLQVPRIHWPRFGDLAEALTAPCSQRGLECKLETDHGVEAIVMQRLQYLQRLANYKGSDCVAEVYVSGPCERLLASVLADTCCIELSSAQLCCDLCQRSQFFTTWSDSAARRLASISRRAYTGSARQSWSGYHVESRVAPIDVHHVARLPVIALSSSRHVSKGTKTLVSRRLQAVIAHWALSKHMETDADATCT